MEICPTNRTKTHHGRHPGGNREDDSGKRNDFGGVNLIQRE